MYHEGWQQNGEQVHQDKHLQLIDQRKDAQVAEQEECYQSCDGQVERGKQNA
jgi:hypothetical protein